MVSYNCEKCYKVFDLKGDYKRHINRKNPCKIIPPKLTNQPPKINEEKMIYDTNSNICPHQNLHQNIYNEKKNQCNYCWKFFSRQDSLNRHLEHRCKIKKEQDNVKEQIFKQLLEEMQIIKKQNEELKDKMNHMETITNINKKINNGTINTNSHNNNNNTINIQLVAYGKENYDKLTDKEYQIIINKGFKSVQEMVKSLHFNKNRPENHNIYISNIRDNYVMIFDGNKWELRNRQETIEELYITKKDILVDKFDEK